MNKFYILLLTVFSLFLQGQTYQFDFLAKYNTKNLKTGTDFDRVNYFNTHDYSYYLTLVRNEKSLSAFLTDERRKFIHSFKVLESNINGEIQFQFTYEKSRTYIPERSSENNYLEISPISGLDSQGYLLKVFKSKKAKKPFLTQNLTLQAVDKNLFPVYRKSVLRYLHITEDNDFTGNYLVKKSTEVQGEHLCESNLEDYKSLDFKLTVPEKLIIDNSIQGRVTSIKILR